MIRSLSLYSAGESNSDCKIENLEYYQMIRSLSLYSAGESNSDCKIENLEY